MIQIDIDYLGDLRCEATHAPSQNHFITDAPLDNHGKGESFSPTDLVATALGTCMATVMGIFAAKHDLDLRGMKVTVRKEMTQLPARRIARIITELRVPLSAGHPLRAALEQTAMTCPVHQILHPELEKSVTFQWADR